MPTYEHALKVYDLAVTIINKFETHHPLRDAAVKIDFIFAHADLDEESLQPTNDAIKHGGYKALGVARILGIKDRTMGRGDAEILIDGDWWRDADDKEREALLDHELHHIAVKVKGPLVLIDDLGRPKLRMRKHDFQFGWFNVIAVRHGVHSQESIQARNFVSRVGQLYLPGLTPTAQEEGSITTSADGHEPVTMSARRFSQIAKDVSGKNT